MPFFVAHFHAMIYNVARRDFESAFQRESREIAHMGASAAAKLIDDETAAFREISRGKLYHAEWVCGTGIQIAGSQPDALVADEGIDLPGVFTYGTGGKGDDYSY